MPRRRSSILDDLVEAPWWVSVVVALIAYAFVGVVVPMMTSGQPLLRGIAALAPSAAPWVALFLLIPAPIAALRQWQRRRLLDQQTGIDSIRALSWREFERLLAEAYRRQGYAVKETGGGGPDGGVDLVLTKEGKHLVQCKHWKAYRVGVKEVRELLGLVTAELAEHGVLVTSGRFTAEAVAFARDKPLTLIDGTQVVELVRGVRNGNAQPAAEKPAQATPSTPSCPKCGRQMVPRTAKRGTAAGSRFWGCPGYPACRGTVDFGG